jgi:hypothetical protein
MGFSSAPPRGIRTAPVRSFVWFVATDRNGLTPEGLSYRMSHVKWNHGTVSSETLGYELF